MSSCPQRETMDLEKVFSKRIKKSSHSTGEGLICLLYVLINAAALWASPHYSLGVGFGSLSAGNTLFTFMTASRNSIFTWMVGIAFDEALVYHRFFGRLMVLLALIYSVFYMNDVIEKTSDSVTLTGLVSLGFCLVVALSSINYIRRKHFNLFFWSHYSFVGLLVGLFLHAEAARPFVVASVACYCIDKGFQILRKSPRLSLQYLRK